MADSFADSCICVFLVVCCRQGRCSHLCKLRLTKADVKGTLLERARGADGVIHRKGKNGSRKTASRTGGGHVGATK